MQSSVALAHNGPLGTSSLDAWINSFISKTWTPSTTVFATLVFLIFLFEAGSHRNFRSKNKKTWSPNYSFAQ